MSTEPREPQDKKGQLQDAEHGYGLPGQQQDIRKDQDDRFPDERPDQPDPEDPSDVVEKEDNNRVVGG